MKCVVKWMCIATGESSGEVMYTPGGLHPVSAAAGGRPCMPCSQYGFADVSVVANSHFPDYTIVCHVNLLYKLGCIKALRLRGWDEVICNILECWIRDTTCTFFLEAQQIK